jgi:hydrogenase-4 membrane subunit HyfE
MFFRNPVNENRIMLAEFSKKGYIVLSVMIMVTKTVLIPNILGRENPEYYNILQSILLLKEFPASYGT